MRFTGAPALSAAGRDSRPALVMPAAGRGLRFGTAGHAGPKPLIDLMGRPFFWWAAQSVLRSVSVRELVFVVLEAHVADFGLRDDGPVIVNDCDHAFDAAGLDGLLRRLADADGALLGFRSQNPAFSYAEVAPSGAVTRTAEKQAISPFAIAGCYLFAGRSVFREALARYRDDCPYPELFVSGMYDAMIRSGGSVLFHELAGHIPFGTPEELRSVAPARLAALWDREAA